MILFGILTYPRPLAWPPDMHKAKLCSDSQIIEKNSLGEAEKLTP